MKINAIVESPRGRGRVVGKKVTARGVWWTVKHAGDKVERKYRASALSAVV